MSDVGHQEETDRVACYYSFDDKLFVYRFTDDELIRNLKAFPDVDRIYFYLSDEDREIYLKELPENLKHDFIWFRPKVNGKHIVQCTCNQFLEADESMDKLAKLAVRHFKRTGHQLNPRGN
jgi:hypothetical protein